MSYGIRRWSPCLYRRRLLTLKSRHCVSMLQDSLELFCDGINPTTPIASPQRKSVTHLLRDFDSPGVFPPSARVDRSLKSQQQNSMKLWDVWRYPIFAVHKGLYMFPHPLESEASKSLHSIVHCLGYSHSPYLGSAQKNMGH